jgi:hypothetical protein
MLAPGVHACLQLRPWLADQQDWIHSFHSILIVLQQLWPLLCNGTMLLL